MRKERVVTVSAERKAALGERMPRKRRAMKQRLSRLQPRIKALETLLNQNKGLYERFVAPMPAKEVEDMADRDVHGTGAVSNAAKVPGNRKLENGDPRVGLLTKEQTAAEIARGRARIDAERERLKREAAELDNRAAAYDRWEAGNNARTSRGGA